VSLDVLFFHFPAYLPFMPPPGVNYLSTYVEEAGFRSEIMDINADLYQYDPNLWADIVQGGDTHKLADYYRNILVYVSNRSPRFIAFSAFEISYKSSMFLAELLRNEMPSVPIIVGGPDVLERRELYEDWIAQSLCHFLIEREGEEVLSRILRGEQHPLVGLVDMDLEHAPWLHRLPNIAHWYVSPLLLPVYASRGCTSRCLFCAHKVFWNGYRCKTPERMVSELDYYFNTFGVQRFYFTDMLLNGHMDWLDHFIEKLLESPRTYFWSSYFRVHPQLTCDRLFDLKQAGCVFMSLGLESHVQRLLDEFHKGTKVTDNERIVQDAADIGLILHVSFIIGFPSETPLEAVETLQFIRRHLDRMDHVEIYLYENVPHSLGFKKAMAYFENEENQAYRSRIASVYTDKLSLFNAKGGGVLSSHQIYSPDAAEIKIALMNHCQTHLLGAAQVELIAASKTDQRDMLDAAIAVLTAE